MGVCAVADAVRAGALSAVAVTRDRLARIGRANPALNAFTAVLGERALAAAAAVDAAVAAGRDPGPLAGVPFGVKDNYDVAGRVTTAGSIVNAGLAPAARDAVLVERACAAGAILLGTQNMDEFAYGFTTENAHSGATHNPRDLARSAGGSSGGSAAALAAGLVDFALGTDTNGSIRVPASFCGIFGLKPTFGRLPRTGTFPFVHDLDHLGPFARSAGDLARIYDALQGHDSGDAACADRPADLTEPGLAGDGPALRIGVLGGWFHTMAGDEARAAVAAVAAALGAGQGVDLPGTARARAAAFVLTSASGGNLHIEALRTRAGDFDPATRDRLIAGALLPAHHVLATQRVRQLYRAEVAAAFERFDLLLAAATPCPAPLLGQPTIQIDGRAVPTRPNIGVLTQPISFVGLPVVAVPVPGAIIGGSLPIAVQLIAPPWGEGRALAAAARLEAAGVVGAPVAPC